jgi:hypothetical protein
MDRSMQEMEVSKWSMLTLGLKVGEHSHRYLVTYSLVAQHFLITLLIPALERTGPDSQIPLPQTVATKPYDWTYTTTYAGSLDDAGSGNVQWVPEESTNAQHTIPIAELSRQDPILFYAEIPLFEDELHDNGASHLLVRIVRLPDLENILFFNDGTRTSV